MAISSWDNYAARAGCCSVCQKPLAEQEIYFGTLREHNDGFERRDYCRQCWTDAHRQEAFSFWQAKMPAREEKKKLFVDNEILLQILQRLAASEDEGKQPFTFVLALIMMRKRLLKYQATEHADGKEIWVVRVTGTDQTHRIVNPHLTEDQLETVREQLNEVLVGE